MAPPPSTCRIIAYGCLLLAVVWVQPSSAILRDNVTGICGKQSVCKDGVILPMWLPQGNIGPGDTASRAIVYFCALGFMFLGVSIIADRFMSAIEVITSQEREVKVKLSSGEQTEITVRIWNETVSNLTLMALGSSAPEILLSVIEICGNKFRAGDLGPSTIVGSAAFNLFIIVGICVYVIPNGEIRRIKHLDVFFVTATWSVFAYLWLYLIIAIISKGVVEIWEGLLTLIFFPLLVLNAYVTDKKYYHKVIPKKYRMGKKGVVATEGADIEMGEGEDVGDEATEFEKHRHEFMDIMRELRRKHPGEDMKKLEEMAELEALNRGPKSRAFYRIQATRKLTGSGNVINKKKLDDKRDEEVAPVEKVDDRIIRIYFEPGHYTVMENVGTFQATVARSGGDPNVTVYVDYKTEDGTANAGNDYEFAEGTLVFHPGETHKQFNMSVIDDDVFEEDEHFYVRLSNIRLGDAQGMFSAAKTAQKAQLANPSLATVMILDDDHGGIFQFEQAELNIPESVGDACIKVCRNSGARGRVRIAYRSTPGSARGSGLDFEDVAGELIYDNDETEGYIKVPIVNHEEYEKDKIFYLELQTPFHINKQEYEESMAAMVDGSVGFAHERNDSPGETIEPSKTAQTEEEKIAELGKPTLGEFVKVAVHIRESAEFKATVDKLLNKGKISMVVGTSSWTEQFREALSVSAGVCAEITSSTSQPQGDDDGDDEGEEGEDGESGGGGVEKVPSCMDYVMHFLTLFWKVLFACVPPTDYCKGWLTFVVSVILIGVLTAIIGDVAGSFGCTIDLKDSVVAITFVALGTSLPDIWGGWACFTVSISMIGVLTAVIGDVASSFGCTIGLKDAVNAISFVALGTSLPDTFASKVAAIGDDTADNSVGNVTGSNAVNVFLGIGVAWTLAAVYQVANGKPGLEVDPGSLAFSVTIFCVLALVCISICVLRRSPSIGGELGGPRGPKIATTCVFISFWLTYIILSSLEAYCYIEGF